MQDYKTPGQEWTQQFYPRRTFTPEQAVSWIGVFKPCGTADIRCNMNAMLGSCLERQVARPLPCRAFNAVTPGASREQRRFVVTCASAASARVKEAPSEIVQPVETPRPLTNGLASSSRFADALPSFGKAVVQNLSRLFSTLSSFDCIHSERHGCNFQTSSMICDPLRSCLPIC